MSATITLTREEIRKAGEDMSGGCEEFLGYASPCQEGDPPLDAYCRLCKRLTAFAKGGEDEMVGTEE